MSQTKRGSILESLTNTCAGFGINFSCNLLILPLFGFTSLTWRQNFVIGGIYTVISIVRGYVLRRVFNTFKTFEAAQ